jgi:large subunit ribosomal protein L29
MKAKELRTKSIEELRKLADDLRKKITEMMIDKSMKKLSKPHLLKMTKKDLARVLTVINELTRTDADFTHLPAGKAGTNADKAHEHFLSR